MDDEKEEVGISQRCKFVQAINSSTLVIKLIKLL